MMDDKLHQEAEELRADTAADAPELQEHDRVAELEAQLEEAKNKALYAAAEVQNVRRRLEGERDNAAAYASTGFARDMLAVRDHLDRALAHVPVGTDENFVQGIQATLRELDTVFGRHGIVKVESKGQPLDPNKHQAMVEIPTADAAPGTIVEEMQAGYMLKDRLLRPALVAVAKAG
ncbi:MULTISPECIES: nucleotide exchange factor GrpE [Sphingomonas]|uniref:nucleotide exchange factor GrpE n=1 Tax=Sphingomonas TaxID=13687 RepID=UPI000DEF42ED|nr:MULTISPECIES: nucleotide exchange factor GrpE [Sphingomonas]